MLVYRAMRAAEDGLPVVAPKRWGLGVRTTGDERDIEVTDGLVAPLGGGTSVVDDWEKGLPRGFIPRELGGSNRRETLFALEHEGLPADLTLRKTGHTPEHHEIQPRRRSR